MGAIRGAIAGSLGLIVLYDLTQATSGGLLSAAALPGRFAHYIVDPHIPLVPDLRPGALKDLPNGGTTQTDPNGNQVYTDPKGHQYLGGPGGIPIRPN